MASERPAPPELERLTAFGVPGGPSLDEALSLFAHLRTTPDEWLAVDRLLTSETRAPLPDPLLLAVATALLDRGDESEAARLLARATSSPALLMRADLAVRAGNRAAALALVERILARDIDSPGAKERHARWRDELGGVRPRPDEWPSDALAAYAPDAPFEIVREVGRGGAATVYEARDRILGRRVALKIYYRADRDRAQLLHEARVAVAMSGPGIVRVFDLDPEQGWLAMEWAPLGPLSKLFRDRETESLVPIARWAVPLAAALARVHAAGWVHHDIKPANVLVRTPEAPLIGDFGSARRIREPSPPGSMGYMSPERLAGRASDARDDVYAFGRVLESALHVLGNPEGAPISGWRALAAVCTGVDERRPESGEELFARALEVRSFNG